MSGPPLRISGPIAAAGFEIVAEDAGGRRIHAVLGKRHIDVSWEGDGDEAVVSLSQNGPPPPGERRRRDGPGLQVDLGDPYSDEKLAAWLAAGPDEWDDWEQPSWRIEDDGDEPAFA